MLHSAAGDNGGLPGSSARCSGGAHGIQEQPTGRKHLHETARGRKGAEQYLAIKSRIYFNLLVTKKR